MQDTLDITGAGYKYAFIWLYTGYSILVQLKAKAQLYNSGVTDGLQFCKSPSWQVNCKNWAPILLIFQYSVYYFGFQ